ncbi:MAG: cadherin-like beta sandwich domain-containing protein [Gammaproteobacteria bacterium]|nr:cadherin-like beta sandwich domain-containing protein [Gammaproteobacteria bacterium]
MFRTTAIAFGLMLVVVVGCGGGGGSNRATLSNNANLSGLSVSDGTLNPTFAFGTLSYTSDVAFSVAQVTVTATTSDNRATVTVNGAATGSGTPSAPIALAVGDTDLTAVVTAEDRTTTQTYRVVVTRAQPSTNANLTSLSLSAGKLDQVFDTTLPNYTASVGYLAAGVQVVAVTEDANASVTVNAQPLSGDTSDVVDLAEGVVTSINVVVTAEDGVTPSNFVIDIDRGDLAGFLQRIYVKPNNIDTLDRFGASVAIEGDWLAIGVPGDQSRATGINGDETDDSGTSVGSVSVYKRDVSGVWMRQAYLKASSPDDNDRFGEALALSGDTLLVGASGEQSLATGIGGDQTDNSGTSVGAAYVFVRDTSNIWSQQAYLKASNAESADEFGRYLQLDGDTALVGSWLEDSASNTDEQDNSLADSGAAYVFTRDASAWTQQAYLKASSIDANDRFGANLDVEGDTLIVGAPREDSNATGVNGDDTDNSALDSGAAYLFDRDPQGMWSQIAYLKAANTDDGDFFGANPDLEGDVLIVGALGEQSPASSINGDAADNSGSGVGAAYEFVRDGNGNWSQATYFKAANAQSNDAFGSAIAYKGNTLIVGARGENSLASGINGDATDNSGSSVGAAYVFIRASNDTWSQSVYVKASNPDTDDEFADALGFDGDTLVVTAQGERSSATGINGNEADDSLASAGAGYVYR